MEHSQNPDIHWYLKVSGERGTTHRCPFASVERCPRFYESLSLLGNVGFTPIEEAEDERLKAFWMKSDLWPKTAEAASATMGNGERTTGYSNFCPEVMFESFGVFASQLYDHHDEIDREFHYRRLEREGIPHGNWQWNWASLRPQHFTECPLYSPLIHLPASASTETKSELVGGKFTYLGLSFDIKEFWRRAWPRIQRKFGWK